MVVCYTTSVADISYSSHKEDLCPTPRNTYKKACVGPEAVSSSSSTHRKDPAGQRTSLSLLLHRKPVQSCPRPPRGCAPGQRDGMNLATERLPRGETGRKPDPQQGRPPFTVKLNNFRKADYFNQQDKIPQVTTKGRKTEYKTCNIQERGNGI